MDKFDPDTTANTEYNLRRPSARLRSTPHHIKGNVYGLNVVGTPWGRNPDTPTLKAQRTTDESSTEARSDQLLGVEPVRPRLTAPCSAPRRQRAQQPGRPQRQSQQQRQRRVGHVEVVGGAGAVWEQSPGPAKDFI